MSEFVEPRVRRVVADRLGVSLEELAPDVSLIDDLAADSLDLVELAVEIERQFGITMPESLIDEIRTYGDVVDTVQRLSRAQRDAEAAAGRTPGPRPRRRVVHGSSAGPYRRRRRTCGSRRSATRAS